MSLAVFLTDDAADDLEEIYNYIDLHDGPGKAGYILKRLLALGLRDFRQVFSSHICMPSLHSSS